MTTTIAADAPPTPAGPDAPAPAGAGLTFPRVFSAEGVSPYDQVVWDRRAAEIKDERGAVLFRQEGCEVPRAWSQLATNIVASKYFYGEVGTPAREASVRQLVDRVTRTLADWGRDDGYFATPDDAERFYDELTALCLNQYGAFNSPVWFNVGLYHRYGINGPANNWRYDPEQGAAVPATGAYEYPQGSACFIQSVGDDMQDIMRLATAEAMLFKFGSGTGTDLSTLRSSKEKLSGGGKPSGPVSFMRIYDAIASVIKSGGKTRRAAKMQTLKVWHPDILEFVRCKQEEERKAHTLIASGRYEANFNGAAYSSVLFQNANLTVRATDAFLRAVEAGGDWTTRAVTTGRPVATFPARELMAAIAEGTWLCGDPGMQYEDTIQAWHTCPNTAPINSSNPCSEYMFIDDSACNLASINLMKFRRADGSFDHARFRAAARVFLTAQEILVDRASYPTARIAENSHKFRPLGLGYANLGSLLMANGLAYDSEAGRSLAGAITAILHGQANLTSAEIAAARGPFAGFAANREPMLAVMERHREAARRGWYENRCGGDLWYQATRLWDAVLAAGEQHGFRNAQVTVLAPTGTIAFLMDCDTTGIEPDIALVKYKSLAGGGTLKIVNQTVPMALRTLGYDDPEIRAIRDHIDDHDTIEGAPGLKDEHVPVFDCAFAPPQGGRSIPFAGHLQMMAAVQPFLSGAISKTVNMPNEATVADIEAAYLEGWRLGLKALAIYRDGSKGSQPVSTKADDAAPAAAAPAEPAPAAPPAVAPPRRERLPHTRRSLTHKFDIQGHEGYVTVGFYADGRPGEVFITMAKEGSTIGGLMDALGTAISIGLQHGVPLAVFVQKFAHSRFEPAGFTKNPDIPIAKSVTDYIARWLGQELLPGYRAANAPDRGPAAAGPAAAEPAAAPAPAAAAADRDAPFAHFQSDAPACDTCGALTVRCGTCYRCFHCGNSLGCS